MQWKAIVLGSVATLVVTVVGGLIVFYTTQEPPEEKSEKLTYRIEKQVSFQGENNRVSIGTVRFANVGNVAANSVVGTLETSAEILEFNVSSEPGTKIQTALDQNTISLTLDHILPGETISITYLLPRESLVDFTLRSDKSFGSKGSLTRIELEPRSFLNTLVGNLLPLLILITLAMSVSVGIFFKKVSREISRGNSKNNIGFVLLHSGCFEEAKAALKNAILEGEEGAHALANLASCLALSGDFDSARRYLDAAEFLARTKHEKAVCKFNGSIVSNAAHEFDDGQKLFDEALELSSSEIKSYCRSSKVWDQMVVADPSIRERVS